MRHFIGALCFLCLLAFPVIPQDIKTDISSEEKAFIDSLMNAAYEPGCPGAVILAARNGRVLFRKGYGMASLELDVPSNTEFRYPIASISKQFTAVSILQLAEKGKISLQDDLRKFLPDYNTHGRKITIEHLLTHTSGILSFSEKDSFDEIKKQEFTKNDLLGMFMNDSLLFEPGTGWAYSNSGYTLLGLIVEKITGMSLSEYITGNILKPLDMVNTSFGEKGKLYPRLVPYYEPLDDSSYRPGDYFSWSWLYSAGDMISSLDDLMKWDEALYTEKLVKKEWLEKAWKPYILSDGRLSNYGYAWATGTYNGLRVIRHDGILGYLSDATRIPDKHVFVAILSNNAGRHPGDLSAAIAFKLAGKPLIHSSGYNSLKGENLREYMGAYEIKPALALSQLKNPAEKEYRYIFPQGDNLYSCRKGRAKLKLEFIKEDLFRFAGYNTFMKFERDGQGRILRLEIFEEPVNYGPNEVELRAEVPVPGSVMNN